jgi:predicted glycosyltransferase
MCDFDGGRARGRRPIVRVWVDITNSPHVLFFRPLISILHERGDEVDVTAREYAQTLELLDLHGIEHTVVGHHGGASTFGKARAMAERLPALHRFARGRGYDVALAHGSHDLTLTARRLGTPSATSFDYEYAWLQHQLGCRSAKRVVVPDVIPADVLGGYGVGPKKLRRYPGLKEDYYLADLEPDPAVLDILGVNRDRVIVVLRPPPDVSLYHRHANQLFPETLRVLGSRDDVHAVVLPRVEGQRDFVRGLGLASVIVPEHAVDAQSLIALADLVVSAGGTMNREAVSLGVPVYTVFGGRLGAVDQHLIREGKLRELTDPAAIELRKKEELGFAQTRRDPADLLDLMVSDLS